MNQTRGENTLAALQCKELYRRERSAVHTNADGALTILSFAGSLRRGSFNRMPLNAANELPTWELDSRYSTSPVSTPSTQTNRLSRLHPSESPRISEADALLAVTAEYNYSVPGVLKDATGLASRPQGDNSFNEKPVAIMSASTGMPGGARAQYHLCHTLAYLNAHQPNKPEAFVNRAWDGCILDCSSGEAPAVGSAAHIACTVKEQAEQGIKQLKQRHHGSGICEYGYA
jgi:chromate reductase